MMRSLFDALGSGGPGMALETARAFDLPGIYPPHDSQADSDTDDESVHKRYRTIFISDLHLGTPGCQAKALLAFLRAHPSDNL